MEISVITPSIRPELIAVVADSLSRQTIHSFEWLIAGPEKKAVAFYDAINEIAPYEYVVEPKKKKKDYYSLNKAWNRLFKKAEGELIINIVDGLSFPPDLLERLWRHYQINPKACITCIGHQYRELDKNPVWLDPRFRLDFGTFYEVKHTEMELCIASFPKQAVVDVGGIDEKFDRYAALSEKEMMARMYKAGYKLYISQDLEYKAIQHNRLSKEWDERFNAGIEYYNKCMVQIHDNQRLKLSFLG